MKKIIVFVILATAMFSFSCNKVNDISGNEVNNQENVVAKSSDWGLHEEFCEECNSCNPPVYNCYDEIVATPLTNRVFQRFISIINGGNRIDINNFISTNYSELTQYIVGDHLLSVLAGNLRLKTSKNAQTNTTFIIFTTTVRPYEIFRVYPITSRSVL